MKNIYLLATLIFLAACNENNSDTEQTETPNARRLKELSWMEGVWIMETPDGSFTELWQSTNDSLMSGSGHWVKAKGDTSFCEQLKLASINDTLWYIPIVTNQNEGKEVRFKEKSVTETEAIFENLEHDFPQRIIYQKKGDSSLYARVEGIQNNSLRKEEFSFKKKQ